MVGGRLRRLLGFGRQETEGGPIVALCHCHHLDLVPDLARTLRRLPGDAEVHVTSSRDAVLEAWRNPKLLAVPPTLHLVENRGRDLRPFFAIAGTLPIGPDAAVLKIHGKRSAYTTHGRRWRRDLLDGLIPGRRTAGAVARRFRAEPRLGLVGAPRSFISHPVYWGENRDAIGRIMRDRFGTAPAAEDLGFFAGSMFWIRGGLLQDLLPHVDLDAFEPEPLPQDGSYAHAIERIIGMAAFELGWTVAELGNPHGLDRNTARHRKIPYI